MEEMMNTAYEFDGSLFSGADQIPWCDRDVILGCEREVAEANKGESEEHKSESIMRLSWALVHSRQPEDVQRGIAMLQASLTNANSPLHQREKLYFLAVGYCRVDDYSRSRALVNQCLEIAPDWRQAMFLKKIIEDKIAKDGIIGIGLTASARTHSRWNCCCLVSQVINPADNDHKDLECILILKHTLLKQSNRQTLSLALFFLEEASIFVLYFCGSWYFFGL